MNVCLIHGTPLNGDGRCLICEHPELRNNRPLKPKCPIHSSYLIQGRCRWCELEEFEEWQNSQRKAAKANTTALTPSQLAFQTPTVAWDLTIKDKEFLRRIQISPDE